MRKNTICVSISLLFLAVVLAAVWVGGLIMQGSSSDSAATGAPIDYVVILGCQLEGEQPGVCLESRIDTAVDFLKEHPDALAVCSGGQGNDEVISEAEAIANALSKKGIAKKRILLEDNSRSTYENLSNTKTMLDKREEGAEYRIAVVTNEFHLYRSRNLAKTIGFQNPIALAAKTPTTMFYPNLLREIGAVVVCWYLY